MEVSQRSSQFLVYEGLDEYDYNIMQVSPETRLKSSELPTVPVKCWEMHLKLF